MSITNLEQSQTCSVMDISESLPTSQESPSPVSSTEFTDLKERDCHAEFPSTIPWEELKECCIDCPPPRRGKELRVKFHFTIPRKRRAEKEKLLQEEEKKRKLLESPAGAGTKEMKEGSNKKRSNGIEGDGVGSPDPKRKTHDEKTDTNKDIKKHPSKTESQTKMSKIPEKKKKVEKNDDVIRKKSKSEVKKGGKSKKEVKTSTKITNFFKSESSKKSGSDTSEDSSHSPRNIRRCVNRLMTAMLTSVCDQVDNSKRTGVLNGSKLKVVRKTIKVSKKSKSKNAQKSGPSPPNLPNTKGSQHVKVKMVGKVSKGAVSGNKGKHTQKVKKDGRSGRPKNKTNIIHSGNKNTKCEKMIKISKARKDKEKVVRQILNGIIRQTCRQTGKANTPGRFRKKCGSLCKENNEMRSKNEISTKGKDSGDIYPTRKITTPKVTGKIIQQLLNSILKQVCGKSNKSKTKSKDNTPGINPKMLSTQVSINTDKKLKSKEATPGRQRAEKTQNVCPKLKNKMLKNVDHVVGKLMDSMIKRVTKDVEKQNNKEKRARSSSQKRMKGNCQSGKKNTTRPDVARINKTLTNQSLTPVNDPKRNAQATAAPHYVQNPAMVVRPAHAPVGRIMCVPRHTVFPRLAVPGSGRAFISNYFPKCPPSLSRMGQVSDVATPEEIVKNVGSFSFQPLVRLQHLQH